MERKAQHVDGRDVALDLTPLSRTLFHQEVYPEALFGRRVQFIECLSLTIVNPYQTGAEE